jgi:anthranilate phosphoribosyltransferase
LPLCFAEALATLTERRDLADEQMRAVMQELMAGRFDEAEAAALLIALRMKGETATEIAAAASVLRQHMVRLEIGTEVLDTCGTGGDGIGTFNISTATALVVAAAGVPVVKHGNRSVSSRSGSADVLAALGVRIEGDAACARHCLERAGLAFCLAPRFHPALGHVASLRRKLGVRTLFNCLGPLANPASAGYQLLGVGRPEWLEPLAGALARLGARRALLVCAHDGLDEISLSAPTQVREVCGRTVRSWEWTPDDFQLPRCQLADLYAEGPQQSAALIRSVLEGKDGPARCVVLANTAAALIAAGRVETPVEGVALAAQAVRSGRARQVLEQLVACSHGGS